jgi:hypothetical protein
MLFQFSLHPTANVTLSYRAANKKRTLLSPFFLLGSLIAGYQMLNLQCDSRI